MVHFIMKLFQNIYCFSRTSQESDSTISKISTWNTYWRLYRYARVYDWIIVVVVGVLIIVAALCHLFFLVLYTGVIDQCISYTKELQHQIVFNSSEDILRRKTNRITTEIAGIGFLNFLCLYIAGASLSYSSSRQVYNMRRKLFETMLNHDITWYDLHQIGNFPALLSENLAKIEDGIGEKLVWFLYNEAVFLACIAWSFIIGWKLTLSCLVALPLSIGVMLTIPSLSKKFSNKALESYGEAGECAEEVLRNVRTVVSYAGQDKEITNYEKRLIEGRTSNVKSNLYNGLKNGILWFVRYSGTGLFWWYGFGLIIEIKNKQSDNITLSVADILTVFLTVSVGSFHFLLGSSQLEIIGIACGAAESIFEILDFKPKKEINRFREKKLQQLKGSIVFNSVHFKYPSRENIEVLRGLSMNIQPGETVALVGPSGCGKSTCIQLLERFYDPVEGTIYIDHMDVRNLNVSWLRSQIGLVSQEPILFDASIAENIRFGKLTATRAEIEKAAIKARVHTFIESLPENYETIIGERGMKLSGGQKQRIALARALIRKPSILLLDEATSALDTVSEAEVQAALDAVHGECTTILVAHRLSTVKNANKILVIHEGKVVEQGTYSELIEMKGYFYKIEKSQEKQNDMTKTGGSFTVQTYSTQDCEHDIFENEESTENEVSTDREITNNVLMEVLRMIKPEWMWITLGILGAIGVGACTCLYDLIFVHMIWFIRIDDEEEICASVKMNCIFLTLLGIGAICSHTVLNYSFGIAGENISVRVRSKMFATILKQDMEWFDKRENGVGALCSKISSDGNAIQTATGVTTGILMAALASSLICYVCSCCYQWKLTMALTPFFVFVIVFSILQETFTRNWATLREKKLSGSTKIAMEALGNKRTVAAFGCEKLLLRFYNDEVTQYILVLRRISHVRSIGLAISYTLNVLMSAIVLFYGVALILEENVSYNAILKVSLLGETAAWMIGNATAFIPNAQSGLRAAKSAQKLFMNKPKLDNSPEASKKIWENGLIEYDNVKFSYPSRPDVSVLKNLNLLVRPGTTVALVGKTGCGKSSIIQLLQRFYNPTSGIISIDKTDIEHVDMKHHRANFGIVYQEPNLFNRTIAENIAYGDNSRTVTMEEIIEAAKNAHIHSFVCSLPQGYETRLGTAGIQVSGGQKQRIAIARAMLRNPRILLLDEATSALDNESEQIVQKALDKAKEGRTCITIAHRLTTIQNADLIYVIGEGKVLEMGNHEKLRKMRGLYYKLTEL